MNKRIKDLALQSGAMEMHDTRGFGPHNNGIMFSEDQFNAFTKAIIQECIKLCEDEIVSDKDMIDEIREVDRVYLQGNNCGVVDSIYMIKHHFGLIENE